MAELNVKKLLAKISNNILYSTGSDTTTSTGITINLTVHWQYKKYANGEFECWGISDSINVPMTNAYNKGYFTKAGFFLPSILWNNGFAPEFINVYRNGGGTTLMNCSVSDSPASSANKLLSFYAFTSLSYTTPATFAIYVKTRWK